MSHLDEETGAAPVTGAWRDFRLWMNGGHLPRWEAVSIGLLVSLFWVLVTQMAVDSMPLWAG